MNIITTWLLAIFVGAALAGIASAKLLSASMSAAPSLAQSDASISLRQQYLKPAEYWPRPILDDGVEHRELGLLPLPIFPIDNPFSVAKVTLGEKLFHDPQLSSSGQIACASCHDRDLGWADGRESSFGHNRSKGKRNAPSIENVAYFSAFFWDGRATSLEQQALMPITDPNEMNQSIPKLIDKLQVDKEYVAGFSQAFSDTKITPERLAKAIATYERSIISPPSPFDSFLRAISETSPQRRAQRASAMSDEAIEGLHLFRTQGRCLNCHNGPQFTDGKFHNLGLTYYGREFEDLGRYLVTKKPEDVGKAKTPGLRGVMNTGPWMHNGFFSDMDGILNIYNAGGARQTYDENDPLAPTVSVHIKPLNLTFEQRKAIRAFLASITSFPAQGPYWRLFSEPESQQTE
ncbi:cytochrome-c peroxidase [Shewanella sp. SR44-3]|uniref:cytochrome-c peroxidase n=1 Tax=Shewanella sp. SR44-3 TaxID=2760936 RepID=UPI0015F9D4AA|nr:cytochrome c peroxidase [Shewanella sp. SR44-3]MBB1271071.1 cytochrome-c peroxidase [Shewanella sp. SR44-3]